MTKKQAARAVAKKPSAKQTGPSPEVVALMEADAKEKKSPTPEQMKRITDLADEAGRIVDYIVRGEEAIKKAKERLNTIQTKELVDMMDEFQIDNLGLPKWNADVVVSTHVHAALPAIPAPHKDDYKEKMERRSRGLAWLKKDGHDGLITVDVGLSFPKGHQKDAAKLARELQKQANTYAKSHDGERPFSVEIAEAVHWKALTSLVKSLVTEKGRTDVPLADLGASVFRIARIEARSERKK